MDGCRAFERNLADGIQRLDELVDVAGLSREKVLRPVDNMADELVHELRRSGQLELFE